MRAAARMGPDWRVCAALKSAKTEAMMEFNYLYCNISINLEEVGGDVIQATAVIGGRRLIPHLWLTRAVPPKTARPRLSHGFA